MPAPRLFLIDGSNQMYRAYHALPPMNGPDGRTTHAIYGFVTMLRKLMADHKPEHIAASFDLAGPTFRSEMSADYKATRSPMPPDLVEQVPFVREACEALGVPILALQRFEADDVMGTLARQAAAEGYEVVLVTGDKDFYQLVGGPISVYNPRDEGTWYDDAGVREKFGVPPSQVADVLALTGDTIDNVKGVPGIGEKGARDLIATHGSLEALLAAAPALPQKRYREALTTYADQARESRELVTIRTDIPVTFEAQACHYRGADRTRVFDLFSRLGFRSLVTEFAPTADTVVRDYVVLDDPAAVRAFADACTRHGRVAMHVLTDSETSPMRAPLVGVALSIEPRQARFVPARTAAPATLPARVAPAMPGLFDEVPEPEPVGGPGLEGSPLAALAPLLADPGVAKIGHDLKVATIVLARHGLALAGLETDTALASYLLDATRTDHRIEDLAVEQVGYRATEEEDLRGKGVKAVPLAALAPAAVLTFAGERADLAGQLEPVMKQALAAGGLAAVYEELERPLVPVLVDIEMTGVRVDASVLAEQGARLDAELDARAERIYGLAGERFNINSPKQLGDVLFSKLQLPSLKKTGKARTASTAQDVLEELALTHELPRAVIDWRALQKLKGTYIDALPALVHPETGRVHTSFSQTTAATGRLSSRDPNLQNVPIRTEIGREIRRAFIADPGWRLISADYSQIELRVLAHLSQDAQLIDAFARQEDIHDRTAAKVFGATSGLSAHELRRRAKIINYALLYGKTAFTLSKDIGVTPQAAQEFIDAYFSGFPGVRTFLDLTLEHARKTGVVTTLFGRRRLVPDIASRNGQIRAAAERVAVNMPIQGTAADILKRAMIALHAALLRAGGPGRARMILTVHDELVVEAREDAVDEIVEIVRTAMQSAASLAVPLTVDVGVGLNWKEAKD
jgi:DNA polymerase-1